MTTAKTKTQPIGLFLRLHFSGGERFGPGKADLLAAIEETGSISEAARSMRMSYRRAWVLVDDTNRLFGRKLVAAAPGGRQGGGATLTPFGRELLTSYRRLIRAVSRSAQPELRRIAGWASNAS